MTDIFTSVTGIHQFAGRTALDNPRIPDSSPNQVGGTWEWWDTS